MKWLCLGLLFIALGLFGLSYLAYQSGRSADEKIGACIPLALGAALILLDAAIVFGYALYRLFT